ncbi:helix-turn-helix domain-containing protein [Paenibacillus mesophilus]|uniref:helix-turn-helix domain-containing protein n=1 Tax=Paenibacillus mesophilus TaxID=2582849 RepID=UPI00110EB601|nr:helix-turn-helix domain-containing protein [Paenibacillus mesophilus]TMV43969.1 helix-turn-helix domain-containing protein [Paenibacillus mesophilus]
MDNPHILLQIANRSYLRIDPLSHGTFRIRTNHTADFNEPPLVRYGIIHPTLSTTYTMEQNDTSIMIHNGHSSLHVDKNSGKLALFNRRGDMLTCHAENVQNPASIHGFEVHFLLSGDEMMYGLGDETRERIQHRGHAADMKVDATNRHAPVPFLMSSKGWGLLVNTTWRHRIDIAHTYADRLFISGQEGDLDYFLFVGDDYAELLDCYTEVAGRPLMMPIWAYGLTFTCHSYTNAREMIDDALNFRRDGIPCDMIGLERGWMEEDNDGKIPFPFRWDLNRFRVSSSSNYTAPFIDTLHNHGFKMSLWLYCRYDVSLEDEHSFYAQLRQFVELGVSSFKMVVPGNSFQHPTGIWGNQMSDTEIRNLYPLLLSKQMHQGFQKQTGRRSMNYIAVGYTGLQQYAATWAGNSQGESTLISVLNHGLTGHANTTSDMDVSTPEGIHFGFLQAWSLVNSSGFWCHPSILKNDLLLTFKHYAKLRYSLIPYIYSAAHTAARTGMPIVRAMPLCFPEDPLSNRLLNQYMFGDSFLVAAFTNQVYLPNGEWIDYWTGERHAGPKWLTPAIPSPAGGPLYVRAGAIIPTWTAGDCIDDKQKEIIGLHFYPHGESNYTLLEDDGTTYSYLQQEIAETKICCSAKNTSLRAEIGLRTGLYDGMPSRRIYDVQVHLDAKPFKVTVNGFSLTETSDIDKATFSNRDYWFFDRTAWTARFFVEEGVMNPTSISIEIIYDLTDRRFMNQPETGNRTIAATAVMKLHHPLVKKIVDLMEAQDGHHWSLQDAADRLHVNASHLGRVFKKEMGVSFPQYILKKRMEHAKKLLQGGNSVSEATYMLGFKDISHFIRVFRKYYGVTPGEIKN